MERAALNRIKSAWRRLRSNFWRSLALDVVLIIAVFFSIHAWQTRDLPIDQPAPATVLPLLDGLGVRSALTRGEAGVVYFFAPWCFYCRTSIGNLDKLAAGNDSAWAVAVALDYADEDEVRAFVEETGINMLVLMGDDSTARDWSVRAFPTYYVIDTEGRISSRSVGYSTRLGMWLRYKRARAW